jgi:hypothetical protein
LRSWNSTGWAAFDRHAEVILTSQNADRVIQIQLHKPHGFAAWRVTDYLEE